MRAVLHLAVLLPLLLVGLVVLVPIPTAEAAPVFFEQDFRGCTDGTSPPPGWTRSGSTSALIDECRNLESFPNINNGTLPGFGPIEGDTSFRIRRADFTCCPLGSHTNSFSTVSGEIVSFGFAFRYVNLGMIFLALSDGCDMGFILKINEAFGDGPGICADSDRTSPGLDSLFTRDAQFGNWVDTGIDLVEDTWYRFRFEANRTSNLYDAFMGAEGSNETLIASGRRSGSADDWNTLTITTRGGRIDVSDASDTPTFGAHTEVFLDWFFVGDLTIDPIPDTTVALCFPETAAEATALRATSDATTDVFWGLDGSPPIWLTIVPGTGDIRLFLMPFQGPPALGTVSITVKANVSSGQDTDTFNLTIEACDPLAWIREFGPAWVIFLAVVAVVFTLVLALWRGAKGVPLTGRRRRRRR